jgi:predicted ATPase
VVFIDRGIPDVLAYMHLYYDSYPASFDAICREYRYLHFILPLREEILAMSSARIDEQAKLIQNHLTETYQGYEYGLIEVSKDTIDNRILFLLDVLSN